MRQTTKQKARAGAMLMRNGIERTAGKVVSVFLMLFVFGIVLNEFYDAMPEYTEPLLDIDAVIAEDVETVIGLIVLALIVAVLALVLKVVQGINWR